MTGDQQGALRLAGFTVATVSTLNADETKRTVEWEVRCSKCKAAWSYPREKDMSAAAMLTLLNHASGHHTP